MRREVAEGYLATAGEIARRFTDPSAVDERALDRDDYISELAIQAYLAWRTHGRQRGFGSSSEAPYVCRAMWNRARDLVRRAGSRRRWVGMVPMLTEPLDDIDAEAQLEARDDLRELGQHLKGWHREVLVASAEGEWGAIFAKERGWHHSRLSTARTEATRILRAK